MREDKVVEIDDYFIASENNKSGNHLRWQVNKYGRSKRIKPIRSENLSADIIKKILKTHPWVKDKLISRLRKVEATELLLALGEKE